MTDKHSIEAVVERCSAAYHNAMGKFGIATPITCALSALQPGDRLPGGNVVVSQEKHRIHAKLALAVRHGDKPHINKLLSDLLALEPPHD